MKAVVRVLVVALALAGSSHAGDLSERLDEIFGAPDLAQAEIGVAVLEVASGSPLYERNSGVPLSLASNTKLITTAAALDRLGPGYRFETILLRRGEIAGEVLEGDLIVRGGGDPCLGARFDGEADGALRRFARAVRAAGIRSVRGDLVADDRFLDREYVHPAWPQNQLDRWYAAPVSALSLNDGCVDVSVAPGPRPGAPALVTLAPAASIFEIENRCVTTGRRKEHVVDVSRRAGANRIVSRGAILAGSAPVTASLAVVEPALVFGAVLRDRMAEEGITIQGETRLAGLEEAISGAVPLAVHSSLLAQALPVANKRSQNHVAELLLKVLGAVAKGRDGNGAAPRGKEEGEAPVGSWKAGLAVEADFIGAAGIAPPGSYTLADGSGLARDNRFPALALARLLVHMARHEHASTYIASLAVAGTDGTLTGRLKTAGLRGRVLAKTGTIAGVSALSGYVLPGGAARPVRSGVAFAILTSGLRHGPGKAREAQDAAVEALAAALDAQEGGPGAGAERAGSLVAPGR